MASVRASPVKVVEVAGLRAEVQEWAARGPAPTGGPVYFIMVPGNPGPVAPYERFMERVYDATGGRLSLITLGHAGHSLRTATSTYYDLETQVRHKAAFVAGLLERHPRSRVILGGHSIGAHMVVEILRVLPPERVLRGILLFPTLLNIGATPHGRRLTPVFEYFRGFAWAVMAAVSWLPAAAQLSVIRMFVRGEVDDAGAASLLCLAHPDAVCSALLMAKHEMREVCELDASHFSAVQDKLTLYFGVDDGWVNDADTSELVASYPGAMVERCAEEHGHAFVLTQRSSERMGTRVAEWCLAAAEGLSPPLRPASTCS